MTESFRTKDGLKLTYRREGSGPLLVCIPGGPGFSSGYLADLGGLGSVRTLILLDPRGTAGSDSPQDPRAYSTADYAADVEALREHLGVDRIDVLGHSHGGVVAAAYGAAYPAGTGRLVIADSLVRLHPEEQKELQERHRDEPWFDDAEQALREEEDAQYADSTELAEISRRFWPMYFAKFDERAAAYVDRVLIPERGNPDALRLFNEGIAEWDMRGELAGIEAPTLVLTGRYDFICGPSCAADFVVGIADAEQVIIEDCGHFTFVEKPQEFRTAIERFLA